jgi:arylsulfatase A-like enzyme
MKSAPNNRRPNVLLMVMDATRASHLSCYGYPRETSPRVDQLAARGVLYEQCISPASWTLEAMASVFTGLYPSQHGANFRHQVLEPQSVTLAQALQSQGYQTALFATVEWISELFGMARGFESTTNYVQGIPALRRYFKKTTKLEKLLRLSRWYLLSGSRGKMTYEVGQDLRRWFGREYQADRPYFVVAHLSDPHWPWFYHAKSTWVNGSRRRPRLYAPDAHKFIAGELVLGEDDRAMMVDYYDGEIRFLDSYMGQMLDWLEAAGHLQNTLVIVIADHGEELTEHGLIGHGWSLYDWILHVPLILYHPDHFAGGQRVSEAVQTLDLFPTILELAGIDRSTIPNAMLGRSLQPDRVRADPRPFTISERLAPSLRRFERVLPQFDTTPMNRQLRALRLGSSGYKLIWGSDGRHELYDLAHDPAETQNLAEREPEQLRTLVDQLQAWMDGLQTAAFDQQQADMDEVVVERLKDLGYL